MTAETGANVAFSVVCLIVAIILWASKLWPKVQIVLMLLAGAGMTAGVIGGGWRDGIRGLMEWTSGATQWAFGAPVPGLLAMLMTVLVVVGWMGKCSWMRGWQRHVIPLVALASPMTWFMTGGIFQPIALILGAFGAGAGHVFFGSMGL